MYTVLSIATLLALFLPLTLSSSILPVTFSTSASNSWMRWLHSRSSSFRWLAAASLEDFWEGKTISFIPYNVILIFTHECYLIARPSCWPYSQTTMLVSFPDHHAGLIPRPPCWSHSQATMLVSFPGHHAGLIPRPPCWSHSQVSILVPFPGLCLSTR